MRLDPPVAKAFHQALQHLADLGTQLHEVSSAIRR